MHKIDIFTNRSTSAATGQQWKSFRLQKKKKKKKKIQSEWSEVATIIIFSQVNDLLALHPYSAIGSNRTYKWI